MQILRRAARTAAAFGIIVAASGVQAQTPEQFYRGKSIDLVIGFPPGGSNDANFDLTTKEPPREPAKGK